MSDYKEMYLHMARAAEEAIRALIAAQRDCEELYMSQTKPEPQLLPFPEKDTEKE